MGVHERQLSDEIYTDRWKNTLILGVTTGSLHFGSAVTRSFLILLEDRQPILTFAGTRINDELRGWGYNDQRYPSEKGCMGCVKRCFKKVRCSKKPIPNRMCFTTIRNTMDPKHYKWSFWYDE